MKCRTRNARRPTWQKVAAYLANQHKTLANRVRKLRTEVNRLKATDRANAIGFKVQNEPEDDG